MALIPESTMEKHYHAQKTRPIAQMIARLVQKDPTLADDAERLHATIAYNIPGYTDRTRCLNCGASMEVYEDILDINDALLLLSMARIVRDRQRKGMEFTDANKIRVSSENIHHTQKCRTTKCSKLGLIAKAGNAQWSITTRGYEALRGEPVPKVRVVFRGQILERPEETTTLREVFYEYGQKMAEKQRKRKSLRHDQRHAYADWDPSDWVHISGINQGSLI
jgi:hypothetical protein